MDHLEELRVRLVRIVIAILVMALVGFFSMKFIFKHIILAPATPDFWTYRVLCDISSWVCNSWPSLCSVGESLCVEKIDFTLQSRNMAGQCTMHITASLVTGLILAFPYVIWQLWSFIKPALYSNERTRTTGLVFWVSLLFAIGVLFGYYVIAPLSINFLANYTLDESIKNQFDITSYISTLYLLVLGSGLIFQVPVIVYLLSKLGIMTPEFMRKYRKHSVVVIFVIAAVITPSPDIFTQLLVALPLLLLFEISIYISAGVNKQK